MHEIADSDRLEWRNTVAILQSARRIVDRPGVEAEVRAAAERVVAGCLARLRRLQDAPGFAAGVEVEVAEALRPEA